MGGTTRTKTWGRAAVLPLTAWGLLVVRALAGLALAPDALVVAAAMGVSTFGASAAAAAAEPDRRAAGGLVRFDIPLQPLATALDEFSRVTGVQVLYESRLAHGMLSPGLRRTATVEAALAALIDGTDLTARFVGPKAVTLVRPVAADASELPSRRALGAPQLVLRTMRVVEENDDGKLRAYDMVLRSDIEQALKRDPMTRAGPYVASLRLWVDPSRVVRRMELVDTTGDDRYDAAISKALRGLVVSQPPPPAMPNPINVKISVRGL
ncbi:hypothetical protein J2S22_001177 [Rhodoplanes tepidamans]|nr:hypothetical protein [Rhodoplanes tepidamans]